MLFPLLAVSLLSVTPCLVSGAFYSISDYFVGKGFLFGFEFEAIEDPTHGRVTYVDRHTALAENLTFARGDTFIMRADDKEVLSPTGPGRKSVRIRSRKTFTTHVVVFDIRHMPEGCGTWPAAWETLEADWPDSGEVDVVEGVNDESPNDSTLHTGPNCTMPENRTMTGIPVSNNCDVAVNFNQGCVVENDKPNSYGPEFNAAGGGWYVMERTDSFIRVFFWSREDPSVPWEIAWGAPFIDTDNYGTPVALFPDTECYIPSHFGPNNIIINLTLCGDWAGQDAIFQGAGCPGTCVGQQTFMYTTTNHNTNDVVRADFVNNNPSAFTDAYWDFAAVRIYE